MSAYTEEPGYFEPVDGDRYRLLRELIWHVGFEGSDLIVRVPAGYVFDVSIPRPLRWLYNPHDRRFFKAAALHDYVLEAGWSRIEAAGPFHQALVADKVPFWRRLTMFLAVALFKYR